jgi:hypothetical protein
MEVSEAIAVFSSLSEPQQALCLARLSYELTIVAREGYRLDGTLVDDGRRLRSINELQHRLSATIVALLSGNHNRYPSDVIVRMCIEMSDNPSAVLAGPILGRILADTLSKGDNANREL